MVDRGRVRGGGVTVFGERVQWNGVANVRRRVQGMGAPLGTSSIRNSDGDARPLRGILVPRASAGSLLPRSSLGRRLKGEKERPSARFIFPSPLSPISQEASAEERVQWIQRNKSYLVKRARLTA